MDYNDKSLRYIKKYAHRYFPSLEYHELYLAQELKWVPSELPEKYISRREEILSELPFTKDHFNQLLPLQSAAQSLNLNPDALFEFIAFIYYSIELSDKYQIITYDAEIERINNVIRDNIDNLVVTIKSKDASKRLNEHPIDDPELLKRLLAAFNDSYTNKHRKDLLLVKSKSIKKKNDTDRKKSYLLIKILKDNLPIKREDGVRLSNKENSLYTMILLLCKYIGEGKGVDYVSEEKRIVAKLLKDFEGTDTSLQFLNEIFP